MQVLTFRHPRLIKGVFFTFGLIVFQPLLGAVLLHSLCCNTHRSAAAGRDHAKRAQYENSDPLGYAFVPLSTETFGRLGKPAMALLNKLADCALATGFVFKDGLLSMICMNSL